MDREIFDLYSLQTKLKIGIAEIFPTKVWLRAEISNVKPRSGGHCYMELSQSDGSSLLAKATAIIWASKYRILAPYFESVAGMPLQRGITVLILVQVNFNQLYGLSLIVDDIDPEFTLGERERLRRETIDRLRTAGLMDLQKRLEQPVLPRSLAIISAQDAAGYGDFIRHLRENSYGFRFKVTLFPALLQGAAAPDSILSALEDILVSGEKFDIVLLLRGGGSELDLACFDDYALCEGIARFPLPVYTAIGHDKDHHVADMVAFDYVKTPTALADEIVEWFADEDARLLDYATRLKLAFSAKVTGIQGQVNVLEARIKGAFSAKVAAMEGRLNVLETRIKGSDPRNIIRRGYILALDGGGRALKSVCDRRPGDHLSLMFADGTLDCTVDKVKHSNNQ